MTRSTPDSSPRTGETMEQSLVHDDDSTFPPLDPQLPPETENPWEYLRWVQGIDGDKRHVYLEPWLVLVKGRPKLEQDALIHDGRLTFGYSLGTVRERLKELSRQSGSKVRFVACLATEEWLAEIVYRPGQQPEFGFLQHVFAKPDQSPTFHESFQLGDVSYHPLTTRLVEIGCVMLPTQVEEYETDHQLFSHIHAYLNTYLQLEDETIRTLACCYIMMTWMFDQFDALAYLRAQGDLGSGKSRFIQTVGAACYRPIMAGGAITPSPIFRILDKFHGTLIIDEADFGKSDLWEEITKILNTGYQRGFPVLRTERASEGEPFDVHAYDVYGPKILATRRRFSDSALESRCMSYTMPLLRDISTNIPLALGQNFREHAQHIRNQLLLWRFRNYGKIHVDASYRYPGLEPRISQIIQPLLAVSTDHRLQSKILEMVGVHLKRTQADRRESIEGLVAQSLILLWLREHRPERVALKSVREYLQAQYEIKEVSARKIGDVLRNTLSIETYDRGGSTWVTMTSTAMDRMVSRYGFDVAQYATPAESPQGPVSSPTQMGGTV